MKNGIKIEPDDFSNKSIEEILIIFKNQYLISAKLNEDPNRGQYYCGITNEISQNLSRHKIDGYLICGRCASFDIAQKVEEELGAAGFDIGEVCHGGNGGSEDSVYVYMVKKEDGFKK